MSDLFIGNLDIITSLAPKIDISSATITLDSTPLVYDGTLKTQALTVTIGSQMLTAGTDYTVINNAYTNAGDYTLSVMGMGNYKGTVTANWSIAKATGSVSVNPSSLSIQGVGESETSTVSMTGDGAVSVSSSDDSIATASISNDTVTVTSVAGGSATITVTLAAGTNYTGDSATISVSVVTISPTLSDNTPEQIKAAAQAGIASTLWSVGAKTGAISFQDVTVGALSFNGLSACAFILGFDHNSSKEDIGIHFQIGMTTDGTKIAFCDSNYGGTGSSASFRMNTSATNSGGWNGSYMRSTICPAFLTALPTAWQNAITVTTKYTDNTGGGSNQPSYVTTTSDKIWLLAEFEVHGQRRDANTAEQNNQVQYDYYKNGNSKVFYKHNATSTSCNWWLRSPRSNNSSYFCIVGTTGFATNGYAAASFGFAPAFRIA